MRYLAIDLGTKTCGIAISDRSNILACPYNTIRFNSNDYESLAPNLQMIFKEENITDLIIGKPKNMDGTSGFATKRSDELLTFLDTTNINIHYIDERLTTVLAQNIMRENGRNTKKSKKDIDTVAATLILESFMKAVNNGR